MGKIITGYKGFEQDFTCRGFQYEVGKTYEIEGEPKLCERGFHFCTSPLAVFRYYDPTNRFAIVQADEDDVVYDKSNNLQKAVARRITIVSELELKDIIEIQHELLLHKNPMVETGETRSLGTTSDRITKSVFIGCGLSSIIGANAQSDYYVGMGGGCSAAVAAGTYRAVVVANGAASAAVATGSDSIVGSWGARSLAVATYIESVAISSGYATAAVATNEHSVSIANEGGTAICTGLRSVAMANDIGTLAVAAGERSSASGIHGSWLVLVERTMYGTIIDVKTVRVDGKTIKEGVRYELQNGKICEVCEQKN